MLQNIYSEILSEIMKHVTRWENEVVTFNNEGAIR